MKFNHKPEPNLLDTRVKTKFLLLPKRIENQTRWLEKASYVQEYQRTYVGNSEYIYLWVTTNWYN